MNLTHIKLYPPNLKKGIAYKRLNNYFWLELLPTEFIQINFGWPDSYDKNNYKHDYSNKVVIIPIKETMGNTHKYGNNMDNFKKERDYKIEYRVYIKKQNWFLNLKVDFKRIMGHTSSYEGLLFTYFDYKYIQGILRNRK